MNTRSIGYYQVKKMKTQRMLVILGSICLSCMCLSGCLDQPTPANPNQSIQQMINAALVGDTISVPSGTYNETIIIDKSIVLQGAERTTTVITGAGGSVIRITADNCIFENFTIMTTEPTELAIGISVNGNHTTIQNTTISSSTGMNTTSPTTFGITINANNNTIENNTISSNTYGIALNQSSQGTTVLYNNISQNTYGVYLSSSSEKNIIESNIFFKNDKGIYMTRSHDNVVMMNTISSGDYGISLVTSVNNTLSENDIVSNNQYGIFIESESRNNIIQFNSISLNSLGIRIKGAFLNTFTKNIIEHNTKGVLTCCGSYYNTIYKNIFINNTDWNAENNNLNYWDHKGFGNFWDNYTGVDSNDDGRGDTPYTFSYGGTDNYPLINKSWIYEP